MESFRMAVGELRKLAGMHNPEVTPSLVRLATFFEALMGWTERAYNEACAKHPPHPDVVRRFPNTPPLDDTGILNSAVTGHQALAAWNGYGNGELTVNEDSIRMLVGDLEYVKSALEDSYSQEVGGGGDDDAEHEEESRGRPLSYANMKLSNATSGVVDDVLTSLSYMVCDGRTHAGSFRVAVRELLRRARRRRQKPHTTN